MFILIFCIIIPSILSILLDGSSTSNQQFKKWNVGLDGFIEFEFKTQQGNGLLLYTDDGGTYDFFEIILVEGSLRIRYNLGGGAQLITIGKDLNDNSWHKVQLTRNHENTSIAIDEKKFISTSRGKEFEFGKFSGNSDVYVGGMPTWYNNKLTLLALPSVIFEPRFKGYIRNLIYPSENSLIPKRQEIKRKKKWMEPNGTYSNNTDMCETFDFCKFEEICISTDAGSLCQCRNANNENSICSEEKTIQEFENKFIKNFSPKRKLSQLMISFGFSTHLRKTLLLSIRSTYRSGYFEIHIVDGYISVTHRKDDKHVKADVLKTRIISNQYYFVRLAITKLGASLQLDNEEYDLTLGLKDKLFQDDAVICVGGCFSQMKNDTYELFTGNIYNLNIKEEKSLQKPVNDINVHHQARNMKDASIDNPIRNSLSALKKKQVPPESRQIMDEIIFSGAGKDCLEDDDDKDCKVILEQKTDDLITPFLISSMKYMSTSQPKTFHDKLFLNYSCEDDEDCELTDGSGDSVSQKEDKVVLSTVQNMTGNIDSTKDYKSSLFDISTVIIITSSEIPKLYESTDKYVPSSHHTNRLSTKEMPTFNHTPFDGYELPEKTDSIATRKTTDLLTTRLPTNPTIIFPTISKPPSINNNKRITSEAAENAALVIGIISGSLIAIIIFIILVLKCREAPQARYRIKEDFLYCEREPKLNLLSDQGKPDSHIFDGHPGIAQHDNLSKKQNCKNIKEWYV